MCVRAVVVTVAEAAVIAVPQHFTPTLVSSCLMHTDFFTLKHPKSLQHSVEYITSLACTVNICASLKTSENTKVTVGGFYVECFYHQTEEGIHV